MSTRALLVLFAVALAACSKNLSRDQAASIIQSSPHMAVFANSIPIYKVESFVAAAAKQGVLVSQKQLLFLTAPEKIVQGEKLLSEVDAAVAFDKGRQLHMLRSKSPLTVKIVVTGVTEDPNAKGIRRAEFAWKQEGLPPIAKRFAADGGQGTAVFRLFDDGWRIEAIEVDVASTPSPLSDPEAQAQAADIATEQQRVASVKQAATEAHVALQQRYARSTAATTVLANLTYQIAYDRGRDVRQFSLKVTDSSVEVPLPAYRAQGFIWFGAVRSAAPRDENDMQILLACNSGLGEKVVFPLPMERRAEFLQAFDQALTRWRSAHKEFAAPKQTCSAQEVGTR